MSKDITVNGFKTFEEIAGLMMDNGCTFDDAADMAVATYDILGEVCAAAASYGGSSGAERCLLAIVHAVFAEWATGEFGAADGIEW